MKKSFLVSRALTGETASSRHAGSAPARVEVMFFLTFAARFLPVCASLWSPPDKSCLSSLYRYAPIQSTPHSRVQSVVSHSWKPSSSVTINDSVMTLLTCMFA